MSFTTKHVHSNDLLLQIRFIVMARIKELFFLALCSLMTPLPVTSYSTTQYPATTTTPTYDVDSLIWSARLSQQHRAEIKQKLEDFSGRIDALNAVGLFDYLFFFLEIYV